MKDRFWTFYYWAMISYLGLCLIVLLIFKMTWNDRTSTDLTSLCSTYPTYAVCSQGADTPMIIRDVNELVLFEFIDYHSRACNGSCSEGFDLKRYSQVQNYYPFLIVFLMTLVRWICIGKHIWQRP